MPGRGKGQGFGGGRGPGGRAGRGRGRGGRGLRRLLDPVLLFLLRRGASHGYGLLDGLREFEMGHLDPSVVYRLLREMELAGWVNSSWDEHQTQGPPRRVYRISAEGERVLEQRVDELKQWRARIDRFLRAFQEKKDGGAARD